MIKRIVSLAALIALLPALNAFGLSRSEKMAWSTYAVVTKKGLGTGVIVNCRNNSPFGGSSPVLLTSAHVLEVAPRGPYYLVVRVPVKGENPDIAVLEIGIKPECVRPFVKHPRYDIAAMRIEIPVELKSMISLRSFISEGSLGRQRGAHVGDELFVLGFPGIFPGTTGAFPVFRSGRIASYSPGPQTDRVTFLVHSDIYAGDSGGPVFAEHSWGGPKLLGLITDRVGPKNHQVPLAIAIDTSAIRETLALLHEAESSPNVQSSNKQPPSIPEASKNVKLLGSPELLSQLLNRNGL